MVKKFGKTFSDIYYQPGDMPVFCYRSGLTVYEEYFQGGALYVGGWNAAGYPLNVLGGFRTWVNKDRFANAEAFKLDIDGESCVRDLEFISFDVKTEDDIHKHGILVLKHNIKNIEITIHTLLDGTPCFTRWIEVKNIGDKSISVSELAVLSGGIEEMDISKYTSSDNIEDFYELGYMDYTDALKEGDFAWHKLTPDEHAFGGRYTRDRFRYPMFMLKNNLRGTILIGQMEYSGGYKFSFDYMAHPFRRDTAICYACSIDSFKPINVIAPNETMKVPAMHIGMVQGNLDDAVNAMHDHVRKSVFSKVRNGQADLTVGAGMGPEHDMSVETTKAFIDQMARAGAEMFIIDAGWYCPPGTQGTEWWTRAGDWYFDKDRYPNGIKEVVDYAHSKGLKLGMWMEVERIGNIAKAYEEHKDWFTIHRDGNMSNGYLDLSNKEVLDWCVEQSSRIIREYGLSLYRVDFNISSSEYFHVVDNDGKKECRSMKQVEGFYELYDRLQKAFPDVIFENCASGGGRADIGLVSKFNHSWVSDNQECPRSVLITNGMTIALPPEKVDRLVAGMGCHYYGALDVHMRNAMFGHISLNAFGQKDCLMNEQVFEFVGHSVDIYKNFMRTFIADANVYHHTPEARKALDNGSVILESAAKDSSKGAIGIFAMPECKNEPVVVIPRGIDISKTYKVTFDNTRSTIELTGYELVNNGIKVTIPASLSSELVLYEEK